MTEWDEIFRQKEKRNVQEPSPELDLSELAMSEEDCQKLSFIERSSRVAELVDESMWLLDFAVEHFITSRDKKLKATCVLYSGGNDSTTLAHLFKHRAQYAIHANTTIGIEQTRQFVRDTSKQFGLELLEYTPPPGSTYRELVLDQGFPGPGMHYKMYQRLKERCLMQARRELIENSRQDRVVFLAGRRRTESARRANVPEMQRQGSIVWVSPLVNWTKTDMNTYREIMGDVPRNEVSDLIHMSGECLCGAFAKANELEEIEVWFPEVAVHIRALENEVRATGKFPPKLCQWGWGTGTKITDEMESGPLCSSCDNRRLEGQDMLPFFDAAVKPSTDE